MLCPICLNNTPKLQKHHIIPKEYGGPEDGPLLDVCASCHLNIHYTAEAEYNNKETNYLLPEQRQRATEFIISIKRAKDVFERSNGGKNILRKIIIELPSEDLIKLHKAKADAGFTSLQKYLHTLIMNQTKKI